MQSSKLHRFISTLSSKQSWKTLEITETEDSVEETEALEAEEALAEEAEADSVEDARCMMQFAQNARKNAKSRSDRLKTSQFFAVIVSANQEIAEHLHLEAECPNHNSRSLAQNLIKFLRY